MVKLHIVSLLLLYWLRRSTDLGWNDTSYRGSDIQTHTTDKFAREGIRLQEYYVQRLCSPTRSPIMAGRYLYHMGLARLELPPYIPSFTWLFNVRTDPNERNNIADLFQEVKEKIEQHIATHIEQLDPLLDYKSNLNNFKFGGVWTPRLD